MKPFILVGLFFLIFQLLWFLHRSHPFPFPFSAPLSTPAPTISTPLGFKSVVDGPFSFSASTWPPHYSPVHIRLPRTALKGVLLLFHGCNHDGEDFFRLLEERAIVSDLLNRSFGAVSFTSVDRLSRCWSDADLTPVRSSFERLAFERRLPIFAFGASSGGSFVTTLPASIPVDGVIAEISPGDPETGGNLNVPIAFIFMANDRTWASKEAIENVREELRKRGIVSAAFEVEPFPLHAAIFEERLPEWFDREKSKKLFERLVERGFVKDDGKFVTDPRMTEIVGETMKILGEENGLLKENILELYNVAWGSHEMTREKVMDALDFLLKQTKKTL